MMKRSAGFAALCILNGALAIAAQDTATPAPPPEPLRVPRATMDRQRIAAPLPVYPEDAKDAGVGGVVDLKILVSPSGSVQHAEAVNGPEKLRAAAIEAVSRWTFQPYLVNGQPSTIETTEAFNFNTRDGSVAILAEPTGPVRVSAGVIAGQIVSKVAPLYPAEARKAHISGTVIIRALISKDGEIIKAEVISGPDLLRDAALDAVKQWKYKPYLLKGKPVEVDTQITVNFAFAPSPGQSP
jgi:TonB family protein